MKFINRNQKLIIKLIAWLQIIGGITGPLLLIFVIGLALFTFSIFAGRDLLKTSAEESHFTLTIINQILQIVHGSMLGWGMEYTSGANLSLGVEAMELSSIFH